MALGIYLLSLANIFAGILDLLFRDFDPAHQPFGGIGYHLPARAICACVAGIWLILAGYATLRPRTARLGAWATAAIYLVFALLSLPHFYTLLHRFGFHLTLFLGLVDQVFLQLIVLAGCVLLSSTPRAGAVESRAFARCIIGICAVLTGIGHLDNTRSLVSMVPAWMPLGPSLCVEVSGIGFILTGVAILAGILDRLAARLLALMLILFEVILVPAIFAHPRLHQVWGGTAYNLAVAGSVLIYAASIASRSTRSSR